MSNRTVRQRRRRALTIVYGIAVGFLILLAAGAATTSHKAAPTPTTQTPIRASRPVDNGDGTLDATGTALAATSDALSTATQGLLATSDAFIQSREATATTTAP